MDNKIIVQAINTPKRYVNTEGRNAHSWGELIALYEDGTWEKLFEYRWKDPLNEKRFNTKWLANVTKEEAIAKLERDYYAGKLEGVFCT